jgi:PEP-CTERM motif
LTGKALIAIVALAVSSASAATVGVVYTRIVQTHHSAAALAAEGVGGSGQPPAKSAVVLNALESLSGAFADSAGDDGAPACPTVGDSSHCAAGLRDPDVRLKILGSEPSPPIWLGGDSEDRYSLEGDPFFWPGLDAPSPFELVVKLPVSPSSGQTGSQDQNVSQANGAQSSSTGSSLGVQSNAFEISAPSAPFANILGAGFPNVTIDPSGLGSIPIDAPPAADPFFGDSLGPGPTPPVPPLPATLSCCDTFGAGGGVTTPEPSTWMMMGLGFAGLAFAGYRSRRVASPNA